MTKVTFKNENGTAIDSGADVEIVFDAPGSLEAKEINTTGYRDTVTGMTYHKLYVASTYSTIVMEIVPSNGDAYHEVYFRKTFTPTLTDYDYKRNATRDSTNGKMSIVIPATYILEAGYYYIGLKPWNTSKVSSTMFHIHSAGEG